MQPRCFTIVLLALSTQGLLAQKLSNVQAAASGTRVTVTYDLAASGGERFKVSLYASHDNFSSPLRQVSGDAGSDREVEPGKSKRIEWNAGAELSNFSGAITFEVRAEVLPPAIVITSPGSDSKYKRETEVEINWRSKSGSGSLELMRNGVVLQKIGEGSNGKLTWTLPDNVKVGSGYQIKITSPQGTGVSGKFKVMPRIPTLLKVGSVAVVGAVAYLVFGGEKEESLPLPPDPQ